MKVSVYGYIAAAIIALAMPALALEDARPMEAQLTAAPSATQFLTEKCAALKLASPPVIQAVRDRGVDRAAGSGIRKLLQVAKDAPLGYRRVKLACGDHVLSEADNWYVPARLTPAMNHMLDTSEIPFGAVVKPLNFHRRTLKMETLDEPAHALRVTALLVTRTGAPFSLVVENYSRALLMGGRP